MKSAQELNSLALKLRREWGEDSYSPIDIFAIVNGWKDMEKSYITRHQRRSNILQLVSISERWNR